MRTTTAIPLPAPSHLWTALHIVVLILVWGAYSLAGVLTMREMNATEQTYVTVSYTLFFVYSILLTFFFQRRWVRDRWLALRPAAAILRIAGGVLVVGLIQVSLVALVDSVSHGFRVPNIPVGYLVLIWLNASITNAFLTGIYCTAILVHRMSAARDHARQLEAAANAARLSALEAQLNPHFLFNSLNSLRGMIAENPATAQSMVTQLSNLLRYALTLDSGSPVRFGQELEHVRDYLALEAIRLEDRLRLKWDIDPRVSDFLIPSFSLQGLVENAIKHGIAPLPNGGEVSIRASVHADSTWSLEVRNTGTLSTANSGTRVGLTNLRERLRLQFGEAAMFTLSQDGAVVSASLSLPIQTSHPISQS